MENEGQLRCRRVEQSNVYRLGNQTLSNVPSLPLQYDKRQMRYTGMDAQSARFKQRSYPLILDVPFPQQSAQKQRSAFGPPSMRLAGWLGTLEDERNLVSEKYQVLKCIFL